MKKKTLFIFQLKTLKIIHSKSIILRNVDPFNIHFQYRFLVITGNSPFSTEIMHKNFDFLFFFSFKDFSLACHRDKCDSKPCGDVNYNPPNGQFGHRQSEADDVFGLFLSIISKFITVPWIGERDSNYILSVKESGMKVSFAVFETVSIIPMLIYFYFFHSEGSLHKYGQKIQSRSIVYCCMDTSSTSYGSR